MKKNNFSLIKSSFLFLIFLSFFISIPSVYSFIVFGGASLTNPSELLNNNLENPIDKIHEVQQTSSEQLDNLMQKWQDLILKNEFLKELDNAFKKINLFFFILTGQDYSFSLNFFLAGFFWLFLLLAFYYIIRSYSTFSEFASAFISFSLTLVNAHLGLFKLMSNTLINLTFSLDYQPLRLGIIFLVIIISIIIIVYLIKNYKSIKEDRAKDKEKQNREIINQEAESITKQYEELSKEIKKP